VTKRLQRVNRALQTMKMKTKEFKNIGVYRKPRNVFAKIIAGQNGDYYGS